MGLMWLACFAMALEMRSRPLLGVAALMALAMFIYGIYLTLAVLTGNDRKHSSEPAEKAESEKTSDSSNSATDSSNSNSTSKPKS